MGVIRVGQNQIPVRWDIEVVKGDTLSATTREFKAGPSGSTTALTVSAALAQVRTEPGGSTIAQTLTTSYSGGQVTWGGDTISLDPGIYYWDLEVTSSEKGLRTMLAGRFVVTEGTSVAS